MAPNPTLSDRLRIIALTVAILPLWAVPVAAQSSAEDASSAMCAAGAGPILSMVLGAIALFLAIAALFQGTVAWNNLGSARKDKKAEGRDQMIGAGIKGAGMFFPAVFAVGLEATGSGILQCVDLKNVIYLAPLLPV